MASSQGIRAGRAFVELFAADSRLVRDLRRAKKHLKAFGDSVRNSSLKVVAIVCVGEALYNLNSAPIAGGRAVCGIWSKGAAVSSAIRR